MCSVVGYVGKNLGKSFVLEGLARLEYRGYDSAGFACIVLNTGLVAAVKTSGALAALQSALSLDPIDGKVAIGHTRWSTHGTASSANAHPQFDCFKDIAVAHNGIIENAYQLRMQLILEGHSFVSQTDTEVIAHLLEALLILNMPLHKVVSALVAHLKGSFALTIIMRHYPSLLLVIRQSSPLCIGFGDGEIFVASDPLALACTSREISFLPDTSFALIDGDAVCLYDFMGTPLEVHKEPFVVHIEDLNTMHTYEHAMLREIYEQKQAIEKTLDSVESLGESLWHSLGVDRSKIRSLASLHMVACGTSWHAARIGQFFFEIVARVPVQVHIASEFRYMPFFPTAHTLSLFLSQSGETADTLEAMRMVKLANVTTIALTNSPTSTMMREADGALVTQAGTEVAVASTKAFSTQLVLLYVLAHHIALEKGLCDASGLVRMHNDLVHGAMVLESAISSNKKAITESLAKKYAQYTRALFIGRHSSYSLAMEAALKLKEISYIFAQAYPAGELKHGPLALVDEQTPVFVFSHLDPLIYQKLVVNVHEVKARHGHVCAFVFEGQDELASLADDVIYVPHVNPLLGPLAMTGVMQFFVYEIAKELGRPIDKPRNLAKSVTVE